MQAPEAKTAYTVLDFDKKPAGKAKPKASVCSVFSDFANDQEMHAFAGGQEGDVSDDVRGPGL